MTDPQTKSLAERIEEGYADAWRPEPGDSIVGFVQEIAFQTTDYGEYPIITVIRENGEPASIHAFHTTLQNNIVEAEPGVGEEIAVKYNGLRLPKSSENRKDVPAEGSKDDPRYHDYRFIVNRAPQDVWGKFKSRKTTESPK